MLPRGVLLLVAGLAALAGEARTLPLRLGLTTNAAEAAEGELCLPLALPGESAAYLHADPGEWVHGRRLQGTLLWPSNAPVAAQMLFFLKNRDGHWYQALRSDPLRPGVNEWAVDFGPEATAWQPVGHHAVWHLRARITPQYVGLRIFAGSAVHTGECRLAKAELVVSNVPPTGAPFIRDVRLNSVKVPCFDLFEAAFSLPDRHVDPFDPAVIDVGARIETPDGRTNLVHGFLFHDFYRLADAVGERLVPQGRPEWRVRYSPSVPGVHRCTLTAGDAGGTDERGPIVFEALPAAGPRYVRRSARAPLHLELDEATPFFPIGHNIRSPFDSRMDEQVPWRFRHPEGSLVYRRYFRNMARAGENLAEVWMCAWSLGLEWSPAHPGYHGAGDYHLGNAWELDDVLRWARQSGVRVNLVLNNHGRASTWCDGEWQDHPYNAARGGFIPAEDPMAFFVHPRALELQRRLLRYIVARWGWDATVFAWELWSELDLTGAANQSPRAHEDPRVHEWHRQMGDHLRRIDLGRHLISTHVSSNYRALNAELANLPQLDLCAVDAYHSHNDPLHIVQLLRETAIYCRPFNKPVLVTEFGGSPMAAGLGHLKQELHAALWSSACSTIAGAPLFWWWQIVEEQDWYGMYSGLANFMRDVDRRDPGLAPSRLTLAFEGGGPLPPDQIDNICAASAGMALAWIFIRPCFARPGEEMDPPIANLNFSWDGCSNTVYRVEFCDTATGHAILGVEARPVGGRLTARVPPLRRDMAVKIRPAATFARPLAAGGEQGVGGGRVVHPAGAADSSAPEVR